MRLELLILATAVGIALLSMAAYRATPAGRQSGRDLTGRGGSFVMGFWVRNWFYWFISPLERLCLTLGLTPFLFNALGVALAVVGLWFFARGRLPAGGAMIFASGLADVLDGQIARGRNLVSDMGAFLDSTLDRYAELALFVGLAWFYGDGWPLVIVVVALGGSLLVSYTRARGEGLGISCKAGVMQRAERMLLMGLGSIFDPTLSQALGRHTGFVLLVLLGVIAAGTMGTSVYRTFWIARALDARSRAQASERRS